MNILLVYPKPDAIKQARFGFSYELLLLATILKQYHNVTLHDYSCEFFSEEHFAAELNKFRYDLAIVECDSFALKRSRNVKNARQILNIAGNFATTITFGQYCCISGKDFSPANFTVTENDLNPIFKIVNDMCKNPAIPFIDKYDDLPYIDRKFLLKIPYFKTHSKDTLLQTSKGCQNSCIFCQRKGWQKNYIAHSDEYVLNELFQLAEAGFVNVWVIDENFTFDLSRAKRILTAYSAMNLERRPNLFISSWANIDYEFIDLASECNVRIISFGIESGNESILKFYRKNINLSRVPKIIQYANSKGIFTVGNFILGAPMETEASIQETFALIRRCNFDQINFKTLDYMIGADLHGRLPNDLKHLDHVFACAENNLCDFPLSVLVQKKSDFLKSYYTEHKDIIRQKIFKYGRPYEISAKK